MFSIKELKDKIKITDKSVECPVKGCKTKVIKMKRGNPQSLDSYLKHRKSNNTDKNFVQYYCKEHKIYVTPSTFIYEDYFDNLLWNTGKDKATLNKIKKYKRNMSQLNHDNSEDAVTWNVFRFLEKNDLVNNFISEVFGVKVKESEVIYWSYSQKENSSYSDLNRARILFGEEFRNSSEPDLIIKTDKALFFIEAKLTANNNTPSKGGIDKIIQNPKKYITGGNHWFDNVFSSDYKTIIREQKYELLRFWLIGTWMAKQSRLNFYLIDLVLSDREKNIEIIFSKHIKETYNNKFLRVTWEDIYHYIFNSNLNLKDTDVMIKYFKNKSLGYKKWKLQYAFTL